MKKIVFIIILQILFVGNLFAQWTEFGTGANSLNANGDVITTCVDGTGNFYAAGAFTDVNGKYYVAKWNGTNWSELGTGTNSLNVSGHITSIKADAVGNVYLIAQEYDTAFAALTNAWLNYVKKWNGTSWSILGGTGFNAFNFTGTQFGGGDGRINAIELDATGNLYAGGAFTDSVTYYPYIGKWNGSYWSQIGNVPYYSILNGPISCIKFDAAGTLYCGGGFWDLNTNNDYIAKWNGTSWSIVGQSSNPNLAGTYTTSEHFAIDATGNIYSCGDAAGLVYKFNGATWSQLGSNFSGLNYNGHVNSLILGLSGNIYVGYPGGCGTQGSYNGNVLEWNGINWQVLGYVTPPVLSYVTPHALTMDGSGNIYSGGGYDNSNQTYCVVAIPQCLPSAPVISHSGPLALCSGTNVSLTAQGYNTYLWSTGATTQSITVSTAGTYTVTGTTGTCVSPQASVVVTLNPNPIPSAPVLSSNSPVCFGDSITFFASTVAGATYNWGCLNGFTSSLQNPIIHNAQAGNAGNYSCNITVGGCTSANTFIQPVIGLVYPNNPVLSSNTSAGSPLCTNQNQTLLLFATSNAGATYSWTGPASFSSSNQNPIIANVQIANIGAYYCHVNLNGCLSPNMLIQPYINWTPVAPNPTSNSPVCAGQTLNLQMSYNGATFNWSGPNSFTSILNAPTISSVTTAATGTYSCAITYQGCTSTPVTVAVTIGTPISPLTLSSNTPVCQGLPINFNANTIAGASYHWSGPNSYSSILNNPTINNAQAINTGTYSCYASLNGCSSTPSTTSVALSPCAAPTGLSVSNITQHTGKIHWTSGVTCAIGYQIYFRRTQYTAWQYANVSAGSNFFTLTSLQNNFNVQWKIRTKCSATSYSAWSAVQTFHTLPRLEGDTPDSTATDELKITAYPNPTDGNVTVQLNIFSDESKVIVSNMLGQIVQQQTYNTGETNGEINLNITDLPQGIYMVFVQDAEGKRCVKIVKN